MGGRVIATADVRGKVKRQGWRHGLPALRVDTQPGADEPKVGVLLQACKGRMASLGESLGHGPPRATCEHWYRAKEWAFKKRERAGGVEVAMPP